MKERLQKLISAYGGISRRKAEELILHNEVAVNGITASLGDKADILEDEITVSGKKLEYSDEKVYIALNKPVGYVTTMSDEKGRKTVSDLVRDVGVRVYPVGRLDINSEGLIIMTNDGEFSNLIQHPSFEKDKVYQVRVAGNIEEGIKLLRRPIELDGKRIRTPEVRLLRTLDYGAAVQITIHEGRNRQVRRMCEFAGLKVLALKRIAVGPVKLGNLAKGKWRYLTEEEIQAIKRI